MEDCPGGGRRRGRARTPAPEPPPTPGASPPSPGAAATPAAAGAIHGKGPARVQSRRRRRGEQGTDGGEDGTGPARGVRPPDAGGDGGASSSRGARPAPLRAPARPTQPLEPILIPKLRIRLADFPYLHCSNMPEAVHLGDLLRIWVRPGARFTPSPPDFQGPARAHRTPPEPRRFPRHGPLSRGEPIPGRPCPSRRKENSPRGSRRLLRDRSRYRTGRLAAPISATPDSGI